MNLAYTLGFVAGIASVAVIIAIISFLYKKKYGRKRKEYDERQEALRGKAYKYAYFTLIAYLLADGVITKGFEIRWAETITESYLGIMISVLVFAIICIKNDAYFSLTEKPGTYLVLFLVLGFVNIGVCVMRYIMHGSLITDGMLNQYAMNLFSGIMFLILAAAMAVKMFNERQLEKRDGDI